MNGDGSHKKQLTADDEDAGWPAWSPDGKKIVYWGTKNGNQDVWVIDADGSNKKRLTDHPALDGDAQWSPDGKKIVFVSERTGKGDLYLMECRWLQSETAHLHRSPRLDALLESRMARRSPMSPMQTGNCEIWTLDLETLERKHLTPDTCGSFVPAVEARMELRSPV